MMVFGQIFLFTFAIYGWVCFCDDVAGPFIRRVLRRLSGASQEKR